jgi:hypothetical protein
MNIQATMHIRNTEAYEGYVIHIYEDGNVLFVPNSGYYCGNPKIVHASLIRFSVSDISMQNSELKKLS